MLVLHVHVNVHVRVSVEHSGDSLERMLAYFLNLGAAYVTH